MANEQNTTEHDTLAYTKPTDKNMKRCRICRSVFFFGTSALVLGSSWWVGRTLGKIIAPNVQLFQDIGSLLGLAAGGYAVNELLKLSLVRNTTTQMFLTIDTLRSFLGKDKVNVPYGPGLHFCFPWEWRVKENNISLEEASNEFDFTVQCADGILKGKGSFRLRPDQDNPVAFLSGVAAVADDLTDLIVANAVDVFAHAKIINATKLIPRLNDKLKNKLVEGVSKFEKRFGVIVGDATVKELLPSGDVQKTLSALTEAAAIKKGTALLLGISMAEVQRQRSDGSLDQNAYRNARDRFMAISGNLEGMNIKRFEIDLNASGIDPDTAKTLTALASQITPAAAALANKGGRRNG